MSRSTAGLGALFERFGRAAGVRFRLAVEGASGPEVIHDSLGRAAGPRREEEDRLPDGRVLRVEVDGADERARAAVGYLLDSTRRLLGAEHELSLFSREMLDSYEQLTLLTSIGDVLGSVVEVEGAAEVILGELVEVLEAGRATLWLVDDGEGERPRAVATRERPGEADSTGLRELERRLARRAFRGRESLVVAPSAETAGAGALAVAVRYAPARGPHRRIGTLSMVRGPGRPPFEAGDLRLLEAVATQIGAAVQTGRLVRESLQRERMLAELEIAHELQLKLLPDLEGFSDAAEVAARCEPIRGIGGDFYLLLRLPADRLGVMLGDVSSHGISAALIMALTMSAASVHARGREAPAEVLERIHGQLRRELESTEMYTSLFYGVLDPRRGALRYANAGHPHAYRLVGGEPRRLEALDAPLGLAGPRRYREAEVAWRAADDILLLFTDGLLAEAEGVAGGGEEALLTAARSAAAAGPEAVVEAIFRRAGAPRSGTVRADDRSALAVRLRRPAG